MSSYDVIALPVTTHDDSEKEAKSLLATLDPSMLISIERCGFSYDRVYRNARGLDISFDTAKLDYLFLHADKSKTHTIGIGDGGNEIGMGNIAQYVPDMSLLDARLPKYPCTTKVNDLIVTSTSNWGAFGIAAAVAIIKKVCERFSFR